MAQNVVGGAQAYVNYGFESAYGTVASSFPRPFGQGVKMSVTRKNNMERIFGLSARNAQANIAKKYEGSANVEFILGAGNDSIDDGGASWLRAVMGAVPTDGGATPYTHSYAESNTLASFSIASGVELGTADYVSNLIGCKVKTCNITAAVGEVVNVKLDVLYKTETLSTSGISAQVQSNEVPLTFAQGSLSVNGTTVGYVQNVDLTIDNDLEMVWGLGSRYAQAAVEKTRKYDIKMGVEFTDVSLLLEKFFGKAAAIAATDLATLNPAGVACVLTFDNGLSGINSRKIVFTFANLYLDEESLPMNVGEVIKEDVTAWALSCTSVVVSNATATDVATP